MNKKILLSVIIPCFNEEVRLKRSLPICISYLKKKKFAWEVLIIDDGSWDNTVSIAKRYSKKHPNIRIHSYKKNLGKGAALRKGVFLARGEYVLMMDADLSVPLGSIDTLLVKLRTYDIVIGVRRDSRSQIIKKQPWYREMMGHTFTKLVNLFLVREICDFTCGFKGFRFKVAKKLFKKQKLDSWAFDAEILFLAQKNKFSIYQIPVVWLNDANTKVRLFQDTINSLLDIFRICYYDFLGKYDARNSA